MDRRATIGKVVDAFTTNVLLRQKKWKKKRRKKKRNIYVYSYILTHMKWWKMNRKMYILKRRKFPISNCNSKTDSKIHIHNWRSQAFRNSYLSFVVWLCLRLLWAFHFVFISWESNPMESAIVGHWPIRLPCVTHFRKVQLLSITHE